MSNAKSGNMYFDEQVQAAIVDYIEQNDYNKRDRIYNKHIHKAFQTIVINIMHKRKVYYATDDYDIVKNDAMGFLITKLNNYQKDKGRAFSYFTVIMQRYMQTVVDKGIKNRKKFRSIDQIYQNRQISPYQQNVNQIYNNTLDQYQLNRKIFKNTCIDLLQFLQNNIFNISKKKKDIKIIQSIIQLLKDRQLLDKTHKKAVYLYIRQITGQNSISISRVLKKIHKHYNDIYNYNRDNDLLLYFQSEDD